MESRHCPYLALPNMVSEVMSDSFLSLALPRIGYVRVSRNKFIPKSIIRAEPNRPNHSPSIGSAHEATLYSSKSLSQSHGSATRSPLCRSGRAQFPVRIYPTQLAPQSAKQSEPSEQIGTVTDYFFIKSPHASSWFA